MCWRGEYRDRNIPHSADRGDVRDAHAARGGHARRGERASALTPSRAYRHKSLCRTTMRGIVDPDPSPLTPDEGCRPGSDLRPTADRCQRAVGYGGTAIAEWCGER